MLLGLDLASVALETTGDSLEMNSLRSYLFRMSCSTELDRERGGREGRKRGGERMKGRNMVLRLTH